MIGGSRRTTWILALAAGLATATCSDHTPVGFTGGEEGDPDTHGPDDPTGLPRTVEPSLPGVFITGLQSPLRMVSVPGAVLATDSKLGMVLQIDPGSMDYSRGIRIRGKPLAIGYFGNSIYVGNAARQTIEVYNGNGGSFVHNFGHGAVLYPSDMAVDRERGVIYVVDGGRKHIKVFDYEGQVLGTISGPGSGADQLGNPIGIAIDQSRGEILLSDYGAFDGDSHASIKIFTLDGAYRDEISGEGSCVGCAGGFSRPQGLAIGQDGRIYVADAIQGSVLVFDRESGQYVKAIESDGYLRLPTDVTVGVDGDLFIANNVGRTFRLVPRGTAR
jgi:DNA-binding beta-propeller fold protein YncE